jgi:hypothetical protein
VILSLLYLDPFIFLNLLYPSFIPLSPAFGATDTCKECDANNSMGEMFHPQACFHHPALLAT